MKIRVERLYELNRETVSFVRRCKDVGFLNNGSLAAMKWHWCLANGGAWYATYKGDDIVSMSGVHPFLDGYRALFRGAQLEPRSVGLNRYHMQSYCFHGHLPYQIDFANGKPVYITTNTETDASGKMSMINRLFTLMSDSGMVRFIGTEDVYNASQNVWLLDVDMYKEVRGRFDDGT